MRCQREQHVGAEKKTIHRNWTVAKVQFSVVCAGTIQNGIEVRWSLTTSIHTKNTIAILTCYISAENAWNSMRTLKWWRKKNPHHIDIYFYYVHVTFCVLHLNCDSVVFIANVLYANVSLLHNCDSLLTSANWLQPIAIFFVSLATFLAVNGYVQKVLIAEH